MTFDWDVHKAKTNLQKHGVSFFDAVKVFSDPDQLCIFDDEHSIDEDRWVTLGSSGEQILVVVHTSRDIPVANTIRIISARLATKNEIKEYMKKQMEVYIMDEMRDEYDFSHAERGKFYIPEAEISLPHYLSPTQERKLAHLAKQTGQTSDELLSTLLEDGFKLLLLRAKKATQRPRRKNSRPATK